eukprot:638337-Prymnesium_polylepis.1
MLSLRSSVIVSFPPHRSKASLASSLDDALLSGGVGRRLRSQCQPGRRRRKRARKHRKRDRERAHGKADAPPAKKRRLLETHRRDRRNAGACMAACRSRTHEESRTDPCALDRSWTK